MDYGQKIAELRKNSKLTQAELGVKLNITAQAVSKWENNLSEPDIDSIRKMCEIFGVSVDEFLGLNLAKKEQAVTPEEKAEKTGEPVKAILGYCEKCKKPVCAGEFKTTALSFNPASFSEKVKKSEVLHTYCNECYPEILRIQQKEIKDKAVAKVRYEQEENRRNFFKGLIWGGIVMAIVALIMFITYAQDPTSDMLIGAIVCTLAGFAITAELIWGGVILDVFLFFCRSFKAPFGLIFELSLDGILWLITVKLALWIICGLLSILWFIIGIFATIFCSIIILPFSLGKTIYEIKH